MNGGVIRLGGVALRQIGTAQLMEQVAFVFQDVFLLNDTGAANIRVGKPDATNAEIEAAARAARCHAFISALPEGYDTLVGEGGATPWGGEKQRSSIARALLNDAPIVMLDEATASVDPENERLIQQAFDALAADCSLATALRAGWGCASSRPGWRCCLPPPCSRLAR
jgi:ATP-binding cassette subfamily B protein